MYLYLWFFLPLLLFYIFVICILNSGMEHWRKFLCENIDNKKFKAPKEVKKLIYNGFLIVEIILSLFIIVLTFSMENDLKEHERGLEFFVYIFIFLFIFFNIIIGPFVFFSFWRMDKITHQEFYKEKKI